MSAEQAAQLIPKRANISMGMAVSEPAALLKALEDRLKPSHAQAIEELKLYYMHAEKAARETILQYQYMDIVKPHSFFISKTERALLEKGKQDGRKTVHYMPGNFSNVPAILADIGIDVFMLTVSPMDKSGLFSCGTNSDYTIPTARIAKTLIVEVNPNMPRVFGDSCLHISEIDAIIESNALLPETLAKPVTEKDKIISDLTDREKLFLKLVCNENEFTYEQIADKMGITVRTVDGIREGLFDKYTIRSKTGLVLFVLKNQLMEDL